MKTKGERMWIDAHSHLADLRYSDLEIRSVLSRSRLQGVSLWIQGGVSPQDWKRQLHLTQNLDSGVIPCFGVHPEWVAQHSLGDVKEALSLLESMIHQSAGVGELGLDFRDQYVGQEDLQVWALEQQLQLAQAVKKPVVIHCVRAHGRLLELLKERGNFASGGLVHSFSGSLEVAQEYVKLGLLISVSGAVLKDRSERLKRAIKALPAEVLVIETDSPDQAIDASLNEPANLIRIAQAVSAIKGIAFEKLLAESAERLKRLFKIDQV